MIGSIVGTLSMFADWYLSILFHESCVYSRVEIVLYIAVVVVYSSSYSHRLATVFTAVA